VGQRVRLAAILVVLCVQLATPAPVAARSAGGEAALGSVCALGNLVYGPVKMVYALFGGLVGGVAYALSGGDGAVSMPILNASLRGDYMITPEHLTRQEDLEFIGRDPEHRRALEEAGPTSDSDDTRDADADAGDEDWMNP